MEASNHSRENNMNYENAVSGGVVPQKSPEIHNIGESNPTPKKIDTTIKKKIGVSGPERRMEEAFSILKDASEKANKEKKDECDLYAELIAKKLRKFNEQQREEIMLEFDIMLYTKRCKINNITPIISVSSNLNSTSSTQSTAQSYHSQYPIEIDEDFLCDSDNNQYDNIVNHSDG